MRILGLDLGTTSIGWALIDTNNNGNPLSILGLGTRVIPYSDDQTAANFSKGSGVSACGERTLRRQMRRSIDRFQLHREQLKSLLEHIGMIDVDFKLRAGSPVEIWKSRADAATPGVRLPLNRLAAVLFHINHRRGYKHAKSDLCDAKQTEYVARISSRYAEILKSGKTVGQYFYDRLKESESVSRNGKLYYTYRIKEKVCPRQAYEAEVDRILAVQSEFYPDLLTEENRKAIKQTIFYQRPLKSCKNLVSFCEFERRVFVNKDGVTVDSGPKVAPRTSPLAQICRIYEAINNISLTRTRSKRGAAMNSSLCDTQAAASSDMRKSMQQYVFTDEERQRIFEYLNTHEKISEKELLKLLGLSSADGFKSDKALGKGIQGNITRCQIEKALGNRADKEELLRFDISGVIPDSNPDIDNVNGEILPRISADYTSQPLYMLWHTLYSIDDKEELFNALTKKFGINDAETLNRLYALDFVKAGYANKSAKFIRRLLPLLQAGLKYSDACAMLGVNHSNSMSREETENRELQCHLAPIQRGELRQPVVEKILNQAVRVVNAIIDEYGAIDEARVELARELKRDKEGRAKMSQNILKNERENKALAAKIAELNILPTHRRIQKLKMLNETDGKCMYCGKPITPTQFIEGHGYEIEHIVPRSRLFDDSFTNKVCACRECNHAKGAQTAYDFMAARGEQKFNAYLDRVEELYKSGKISKGKRDRLLMTSSAIPDNFIERDLRLTQYITKKSMEIMSEAISHVYASSGSVTDFFRHAWGYDTILHDINLPKYESAGLTEDVEYETHGQKHAAHRIADWSKRKDHRHHALDALVIALTRQGYIQRLNTLNVLSSGNAGGDARRGLDKWAAERPHIGRREVINALENMAVSFKAGKKLVTSGKRYIRKNGKRVCVQKRISVPRAPLHKETIYGCIKVYDGKKKLKYALQNLELIVDNALRKKLQQLLRENDSNVTKVLKMLKNSDYSLGGRSVEDVACFRVETVVKYPLESITNKDVRYIVDSHIRNIVESRFAEVGNIDLAFVKSLVNRPLYSDAERRQRIRTVRLFSGLKIPTLAGVRKNEAGTTVGYAQKRNNHHVAFYRTPEGKVIETAVSFWDCVKRKNIGLPAIIKNTMEAWDLVAACGTSDDTKEIVATLPPFGSEYIMSLQRNEMVVLGMSDDEWNDAVASENIKAINKHLYRVWKLGSKDYCFKHFTNTIAAVVDGDKELKQHFILRSIAALAALHPRKVTVSILGKLNPLSDDKESLML